MRCSHFSIFLFLLPSCEGCPTSKPYVPFSLNDTSSTTHDGTSSTPLPTSTSIKSFSSPSSTTDSSKTTEWKLNQNVVHAPPGRAFRNGLSVDADLDETQDLVVWSQTTDGARGEVSFASGKRPQQVITLAASPREFASANCEPIIGLYQNNPHTLFFDANWPCVTKGFNRWISLFELRVNNPPTLSIDVFLRPFPVDEKIEVIAEETDLDKDGVQDTNLSLKFVGNYFPDSNIRSPDISIQFPFFHRDAGPSRDPSAPALSFRDAAETIANDSKVKNKALSAFIASQKLEHVFYAVCSEYGMGAVALNGEMVRCDASTAFFNNQLAQLRAAVALNDIALIQSKLSRIALLSPNPKRQKEVEKLAPWIPNVPARIIASIKNQYVSVETITIPAIHFDDQDNLLVQSNGKWIRVDHTTLEQSEVESSITLDPFVTVGGAKLIRIEHRCNNASAVALWSKNGETILVPTPLLGAYDSNGFATKDTRCTADAALSVKFVGYTSKGDAVVSVGTDLLQLHPEHSGRFLFKNGIAPGSLGAASTNGKFTPLITRSGLLILGETSPAFWQFEEKPIHCKVANSGDRVACVVSDGVILISNQ